MSADNWAVCPRCRDRARASREALFNEAAAAYGKVSADEYEALRARASEPIIAVETFREDYEFYGVEDGTITASYSGSCTVCHLETSFKHVHPFYDGTSK